MKSSIGKDLLTLSANIKCAFRCIFPYTTLRSIASKKRNKNIKQSKLTDGSLVKLFKNWWVLKRGEVGYQNENLF